MNFIDTKTLFCALGPDDLSDRPALARRLLAEGNLAFSVQVFPAFFVQSTHPRRQDPVAREEAAGVIEFLAGFPVRVEDLERFRAAPAPQRRRQCSFRDAKILAAASAPGCDVVYSEDLKSARDHRGVKGVNPLPR